MNALSAADIRDANDLDYVNESVPEWPKDGQPGVIRLQQLDAADTMEMTDRMGESPKLGMFIIIVFTACDPISNEKLFPLTGTVDERKAQLAEYVASLQRKNFKVLDRLQRVAMRVNAMGPQAQVKAKNG